MPDKTTIFASAAGNDDIVFPVILSMLVAKINEFLFASLPINFGALVFGVIACRTNSMFIKSDPWSLIRNSALFAEQNLGRKVVLLNQVSF
jgi:hypothetical protein